MRRRYAKPTTRALPDVGLPAPKVSAPVLAAVRALSGPYIRFGLGFRSVRLVHGDRLVSALAEAQRGEARVILALRHAYGDEAQLVSWMVSTLAPKSARELGVRLATRPHAVFAHGYEVPRWSGPLIRFLLPRVGAMPVHHDRLDVQGLNRIRDAIVDGPYPLAIAPEGQVSYTSDAVPRLEPGVFGLGFGAAERLAAAGRPERVLVVPLSNHYRYGRGAPASLARLVSRLERFIAAGGSSRPATTGEAAEASAAGIGGPAAGIGGPAAGIGSPSDTVSLSARLSACRDILLSKAEGVYGLRPERGAAFVDRMASVTAAALGAAERLLGIGHGSGDHFARLYRVRREGWDRIYLPPGNDPRRLGDLDGALADRKAGEAWYALRHMELADLAWYLRSNPPGEGAPFHELAECAQNLWDLANRLAGGTIAGRLAVRPKRAVVIVAEPIDLRARLDRHREGRKSAVAAALSDLRLAFEQCIKESRDEKD